MCYYLIITNEYGDIKMSDYNSINNFILSCNELIEGKYILADIKIGKILKAISQSDEIYNLLAESLINYDFDKELARIQSMNRREGHSILTIPDDYSIIVPFVFSLLVEIDSKHISFSDFLSENFPLANSQKDEYEAFARHIVVPFRDAIADIFTADTSTLGHFSPLPHNTNAMEHLDSKLAEEEPLQEQVQPKVFEESDIEKDDDFVPLEKEEKHSHSKANLEAQDDNLLFDSIARNCGIIRDKLPLVRKELVRSNISLIIDALIEACYLRNFTILVALVMSLSANAKHERVLRDEVENITEICYQFYD